MKNQCNLNSGTIWNAHFSSAIQSLCCYFNHNFLITYTDIFHRHLLYIYIHYSYLILIKHLKKYYRLTECPCTPLSYECSLGSFYSEGITFFRCIAWKRIAILVRAMLTHSDRNKMDAIFQTTFSDGFSWMKMYEFRLKFNWNLFLGSN